MTNIDSTVPINGTVHFDTFQAIPLVAVFGSETPIDVAYDCLRIAGIIDRDVTLPAADCAAYESIVESVRLKVLPDIRNTGRQYFGFSMANALTLKETAGGIPLIVPRPGSLAVLKEAFPDFVGSGYIWACKLQFGTNGAAGSVEGDFRALSWLDIPEGGELSPEQLMARIPDQYVDDIDFVTAPHTTKGLAEVCDQVWPALWHCDTDSHFNLFRLRAGMRHEDLFVAAGSGSQILSRAMANVKRGLGGESVPQLTRQAARNLWSLSDLDSAMLLRIWETGLRLKLPSLAPDPGDSDAIRFAKERLRTQPWSGSGRKL